MQLLKLPQVCEKTTLKRTTLLQRIREGTFPKPIALSPGKGVAWIEQEVDAWIAERAAARAGEFED